MAQLNRIAYTAVQPLDFQEMLQMLAEQLARLVEADSCYITLWDEQRNLPIAAAAFGAWSDIYRDVQVLPGERTLTQTVLETRKTLVESNLARSPHISARLLAQLPAASMLGLPLLAGDQKLGAALLGHSEPHQFDDDEIALAEQAAVQISLAIARTRSLESERQQRRLAETQLDFSFQLMETTSLADALGTLLSTLEGTVAYDAGSVMIFPFADPSQGQIAAASGYTDTEQALSRTVDLADFPLLAKVRGERTLIYIPDLRQDAVWLPGSLPDPAEVRSILMAPLRYSHQGKVIGCLTLKSFAPNAFSLKDRQFVQLLCNQTAGAAHNLLLLEETRRHLTEVSVLAEVSEQLNRTSELNELLQFALDQAIALVNQDKPERPVSGAIILRQSPGDSLHLAVAHNIPAEEIERFNRRFFQTHEGTFAQSVLRGEWVEITTREVYAEQVASPIFTTTNSTLLNIPLNAEGKTIGVIALDQVVADPITRRLLGTLAELAAAAIRKAQLLEQARGRAVELIAAYEELHALNRQREEFIQNMTHDLRAPLTFVQGYVELLMEGALGTVSPEQMEALEIIQDRSDTVIGLVGEILKTERIEAQPLQEQPVDIDRVAQNAVRSARITAQKAGLTIAVDQDEDLPMVLGDAARLGQVFDNLLSNAIKFSPNGGTIRIGLHRRGTKVLISVADPGIGVPPAELEQIWHRYYRVPQTSDEYAGTGLGLAIVRRIVEAHGGHIWATNNTCGTTFTCELPALRTG